MRVTLNAAVRIIPPSEVCDHWVAENLLERRRYRLSAEAAAVLVAAGVPADRDDLAERVAANDGHRRPAAFWAKVADTLCRSRLMVDPAANASDPRVAWLVRLREDWSRHGWHEAAEYHALTYDYPCLDYSEAARAIATDQQLMRLFQSREPDADRVKLDYVHRPGVDLPEPAADMPTGPVGTLWDDTPGAAVLDADRLATILSLTFGSTGERRPRTDAAPLLRRSSPSGGARHPSEGYVVVRDVPGLEPGWYHVTMSPFSLRRLAGPGTDEQTLSTTFRESTRRFPLPLRALVVLTSTFERNMYRYREPRTFRTVHMDVGHLAATLRMCARALGVTARIFYSDEAGSVERALGLDGMREGYMLTVAFSDGAAAGPAPDDPEVDRAGRS
jgi:SagB-type dehydrogenase family enzyme